MREQGFATVIIVGIIAVIIAAGVGGYILISKRDTVSEINQEQKQFQATEESSEELPKISEEPGSAEKTEKKSAPESTSSPVETKPPAIAQNPCSRPFSPQYGSGHYYTGPLFDVHFHMPNMIDPSKVDLSKIEGHDDIPPVGHAGVDTDAELDKLLCNFEREKVKGAIGFTMGEEQLLDETLAGARSMKARVGSKVALFLSPVGFSATTLENIQTTNEGLFEGYGELSFGFGGGLKSSQNPDDQNFLDIYKVAGKNNLVVMIHIGARQESRIENILQKNPNVTFLFHGPESENSIHGIIEKYPNAYYSIDAMLIRLPSSPAALMYTVSGKNEFKTKFVQNYSAMLNNTLNQWKSKIEQYPDRYMWGTDRSETWTYDEDISAMLEEFARGFIGELDSLVQERFAHKNAEKLLQK